MNINDDNFGVSYSKYAFTIPNSSGQVIPKYYNDISNMNALVLILGFDTDIDADLWNNTKFARFIEDIENNIESTFNYIVDSDINGGKKGYFKYKDMKIEFKVFDYGKWYDTACFNILPVHMHRLRQIFNVIETYITNP